MAEKKKSSEKKYVTVECALLNVRMKPNMASSIVRQESKGTKLEKLGTTKEWTKVPGGYVMTKFVS